MVDKATMSTRGDTALVADPFRTGLAAGWKSVDAPTRGADPAVLHHRLRGAGSVSEDVDDVTAVLARHSADVVGLDFSARRGADAADALRRLHACADLVTQVADVAPDGPAGVRPFAVVHPHAVTVGARRTTAIGTDMLPGEVEIHLVAGALEQVRD